MKLARVPITSLTIDESRYPDREKERFIESHLLHFCRKRSEIPSILVVFLEDGNYVKRGHIYTSIASAMNLSHMTAVIDSSSNMQCVKNLREQSLISDRQKDKGVYPLVSYIWFVYFFKRSLSSHEKEIFEEKVVFPLTKIEIPNDSMLDDQNSRIKGLRYLDSSAGVEFEAYVPTTDERWYSMHRQSVVDFHLNYVKVQSFRGRRFHI